MLEYIINPIKLSDFLDNYWDVKPLLITRDIPSYFDDILTLKDVDCYLQKKNILFPSVRLYKDGNKIPLEDYTNTKHGNESIITTIDNDKMYRCFDNGATIIMDGLHRDIPKLFTLCNSIEKILRIPVATNIYLTPKNSQGFDPHWDTHDVLILQVSGSKIWKIYDSPLLLPTENQKFKKENWARGVPLIQTELKEGDSLFIPRGFIHEAISANSHSLHVTVGINNITLLDLIKTIFESAVSKVELRSSVPFNITGDSNKFGKFEENLKNEITKYICGVDVVKLLQEMELRFIAKRHPDVEGRIHDLNNYQNISIGSVLSVRQGTIFKLLEDESSISLSFNNKKISFPAFVTTAIKSAIEQNTFAVFEIKGSLDNNSKLLLCKTLIREGFLKVINEG